MARSALALTIARGAVGGVVGTAAMTALMLAAGRAGLVGRQPPDAISRTAVRRATGVEPRGSTAGALSTVAHLGFGVSTGVLYAALPAADRVPPPVRGAAFGVAVWAASYLGWVPRALRALPSAEDDRNDRVAVMVAAHVLYGTVLGAMDARWRTGSS